MITLNLISIRYHFRRSRGPSRLGTLFVLLVTYIVYALLTLLSEFKTYKHALFDRNDLDVLVMLLPTLTRNLAPVIVSFSSSSLAFDRVLAMFLPFRYAQLKISGRLAAVATFANSALLTICYGIFFTEWLMDAKHYHFGDSVALKYTGLSSFLFLELTHYSIFLIKLQRLKKSDDNSMTNHIVLFQVFIHSIFCVLPALVQFVEYYCKIKPLWNGLMATHEQALFALGVLLSSCFIMYKMKPKKAKTTMIMVTSTANLSLWNK